MTKSSSDKRQIPLDTLLVTGGLLLVCLIALLAVIVMNDGTFTYTLDDPYIHLAVAEEIARGHYGVNPDEFSAPSSSPLWPFLLAPLARTAAAEYFPLVINFCCGLLSAAIVLRGMRRCLPDDLAGGTSSLGLRVLACWVVILGSNIPGLIFTGMEHSLQLLTALVVAEGLVHLAHGGEVRRLFLAGIILGPLIRYENLALSAVACGALIWMKRPKSAICAGIAALLGLFAFSVFLKSLGLPPVPSSITAKSHLASGDGAFQKVVAALVLSLSSNRGALLLLMAAAIIRLAAGRAAPSAIALAVAGLLHACFGAYGWFNRYECYIFAALLYGLFTLRKEPLTGGLASTTALGFAGLVLAFPYIQGLFQIPLAANNIYEQQYQMGRFARDWWKKPVAVNDLGWVSFRNDHHVLDFWGLGSHEALRARTEGLPPSWMTEMAQRRDVQMAMVYENLVPVRAAGWIKVGELHLSGTRITPAASKVTFFATTPSAAAEVETKLQDFRNSLPPAVNVVTRADRTATSVAPGLDPAQQ